MKPLLPFAAGFIAAILNALKHYATGDTELMALYTDIAFTDLSIPNKQCDDREIAQDYRLRALDPDLYAKLIKRKKPITARGVSDVMKPYYGVKAAHKVFPIPHFRLEILKLLQLLCSKQLPATEHDDAMFLGCDVNRREIDHTIPVMPRG